MNIHSMLPSMRADGDLDPLSAGPEFDAAMKELRAARPLRDARLIAAAKDIANGRLNEARTAVSEVLRQRSNHPDALNVMAEIADREGRRRDAESLLARCVRSAAAAEFYRYNYAAMLEKLDQLDSALAETELLLKGSPRSLIFRNLKACLLKKTGRYADSATLYRALTEEHPESAYLWNAFGAVLRDLGGHTKECTEAFLKAAGLYPARGRIWWNLSNMKTFRFGNAQIAQMEAALSARAVSADDRAELHYALGKAYDDAKNYARAFENYSKGNALRGLGLNYNPDSNTAMVARTEAVFTPAFFRSRQGFGSPSPEPIFVLGMQRSGSTLVEQILASHSQVEGLGELNFILMLVGDEIRSKHGPDYPNGVDRLELADLHSIGEKYLACTRLKRHSDRPFFVDKCPYNFWHVGLIRLILPNAKIIDTRRHPMACCFANFSTNFAFGPPQSCKQTDISRFYADYVRLMAHFDRVQPGRIHRVVYERLIASFETEVRRILDYLELPFERDCLEFYRNARPLNSLSSEQVRTPIYAESTDRWRNFEPWLGPMKSILAPFVDTYPDVPDHLGDSA